MAVFTSDRIKYLYTESYLEFLLFAVGAPHLFMLGL